MLTRHDESEVDQKAAAIIRSICIFMNNWCGCGSIAATCRLDGVPHPANSDTLLGVRKTTSCMIVEGIIRVLFPSPRM